MIIDLTKLLKSNLDFEYALPPETIDLAGEAVELTSPVQIQGRLKRGIAQVTVTGEIAADVLTGCTRCLEPTARHLEIAFVTEFVTADNYTSSKEAELQAADLDAAIFAGDEIDLTEIAREQILLHLPEQIFCREDCRGLCEKCGVNRNLLDCKCIEKEFDPRWAALKNLN